MASREQFHDAEVLAEDPAATLIALQRAEAAVLARRAGRLAKAEPVDIIFDRLWQETAANHALDLVEDRHAPPVAAAFTRAWRAVGANANDPATVAKALERLRADLQRTIQQAARDGAVIFANGAPSPEFQRSFRVPNPWAEAWAATRAGELVSSAEADMREMIRVETTASMAEGENPLQLAQRLATSVGLTPQYRQAVERFRKTVAEKTSPAQARRAAGEYADRLRASRAETIARTEMLGASNQGQLLAWRDRARRGLLPAGVKREWIIARDERTCPACRKMTGDRAVAELNVPFSTPHGDIMTPPMHPRCRCTTALVYSD